MLNSYVLLMCWVFLNSPSAGLQYEVLSCIFMLLHEENV